MATRTITFNIVGTDNLSGAIKSAQAALRGLSTKTLASAKALDSNRALLNQIGAYRRLQQSIKAAQNARADELLQQSRLLQQRKQAQQQLSDMRRAYASLNDFYKTNKRSLGTEAAQVFKEQLAGARSEIKAQKQLISGLGKSYDASEVRANRLGVQIATEQRQLALSRTSLPAGSLAGQEMQLRAQIQATTNALNAEIAALERRNQIQANFSNAQAGMADAWSNFQSSLQTASTLMSPFTAAAENAISFEAAMKKVEGLTQMRHHRAGDLGTVQKNMKILREQAKELGRTTEYFSTDIAEAMSYYGYAGWDTKQIKAVMPSTVNMATVTKVPLARVADMFSDDLTVLGIRAGETIKLANGKVVDAVQHTADAYTFAVTNANMNMEDLHTALTYNAGGLRLAGLSTGDIFGFNMILANAGIKASKAGTALNTGVIRLMAPAKKGAKALEELGLTASEAEKEMARTQETLADMGLTLESSVIDKIQAMKRAWDENKAASNDAANAAMLDALVGKNAFKGWAELFDSDKLDQALGIAREIDSGQVEGWTEDTAAVMRDTTETQIKYLESAFDALKLSAGEALSPLIRDAAEALTPLVQSLAEFVAQHPAVVQAAAAIAAALSTIVVAAAGFGVLAASFRLFTSGLTLAGSMLGGLGSTLGGVFRIIAGFPIKHPALTAIATIGLLAYENWDKVSQVLSTLGSKVSGFMAGLNSFIPRWQEGDFSGAIEAFKNAQVPAPTSWGEFRANEQSLNAEALQASVDSTAQALEAIPNPAYNVSESLLMVSPATEALVYSAQGAAASTDMLAASGLGAAASADMLAASGAGAAASTDMLAASAAGSTGNINSMSASAAGSTGSLSAMGSSAASASGSVSGLGAAAQSAIGALLSAGASAAGAIRGALSSAASYVSGLVGGTGKAHGGYVSSTTHFFAGEHGPEMVIPLTEPQRAESLWSQTGQMLGLSGENISLNVTINVAGNSPREDLKQGVYEAIAPLERMLKDYQHERRRRAYV